MGHSEDTGALFEDSVSTGLGFMGLGGPKSTLGVATNWGDVKGGDDQWMSEIYYLWTVAPQLELTFNYQWIANPALNADDDNISVAGLRIRFTL